MAYTVGDLVNRRGFFSKAQFFRGVSPQEVERRAGYRAGRLSEGWHLLFMTKLPSVDEFEVRGYTQMSGGVAQGHLPNPPDPRNSEEKLKQRGYDLTRIKQGLIDRVFKMSGPERLAKVVPVRGELGQDDYPPGAGIPQWELVKSKPFKVAAFVAPGEKYLGNFL